MKKFLTVLLVIAVMFTFSFGSAFAAVDYDKALAGQYFELEMKEIKDAKTVNVTDGVRNYPVKYAVFEAHKAELLDAYLAVAKETDASDIDLLTDVVNATDAITGELLFDFVMDFTAEQYNTDKAANIAILEGLDLSKISTKEFAVAHGNPCYCETYLEHVEYLIAGAIKTINSYTFTSDSDVEDYVYATLAMKNIFDKYDATAPVSTALVAEKGYEVESTTPKTYVGLGVYALNDAYAIDGSTTLANYKADYVDAMGSKFDADVATKKAEIASKYAALVGVTGTTAAQKAHYANVKTMLDFLAPFAVKGVVTVSDLEDAFTDSNAKTVADALVAVDTFVAQANTLAAETDATGTIVRDAEDLADLVEAGKVYAYATALEDVTTTYTDNLDACLAAIKLLYNGLGDEELDFAKKYREAMVALAIEEYEEEETYYPAELAKVKALCEEYLAKVNAVTDIDKIADYDDTYENKVEAIMTAEYIDNNLCEDLEGVAESYLSFVNNQITKDNNRYYYDDYNKLHELVHELVGNSGARTTKDIAALSEQAIALVKTLPTNAAVEAAEEAMEDALEAIPTVITVADKATVDAAIAAVEAYDDMIAADNTDDLEDAVKKYAYAYNNAFAAKVKAVSATDKAAIEALIDEAEAFVEEYDDVVGAEALEAILEGQVEILEGYLTKIQDAAAQAVVKAIAAIPVAANLTQADKAKVEAARALYDAYVAEYTDYEDADGFVAGDFDEGTLFAAEAALGLNDNSEEIAKIEAIASVEGLKITAKSSAKKGAITVKWTVEGDDANVQYYEVRKSTKKNSGYGTKPYFTTTKMTYKNTKGLEAGTRYYFKVRAVAEIDGEVYVSDWSNKAYRVAK